MHTIAVIEDDALIRDMISLHLNRSGFIVEGFSSAEAFLQKPEWSRVYDLIILDIYLPDLSGEALLKQIRETGDQTPVIMLTAKSSVSTRLRAFSQGADDFLPKPFNLKELQARVSAVIRRSQSQRRLPSSELLVINEYEINTVTRNCQSRQGKIRLSEKEIDLLKLLVIHTHETLSRVDILEEVWGMDTAPTPRTVDNFILKFRKLFEDVPEQPRHFISVHGKGYMYKE